MWISWARFKLITVKKGAQFNPEHWPFVIAPKITYIWNDTWALKGEMES